MEKTKIGRSIDTDEYIYLEVVAEVIGDIIHDIEGNKPERIAKETGTSLPVDEVARLYRQYREKGGLEKFCRALFVQVEEEEETKWKSHAFFKPIWIATCGSRLVFSILKP